MTGIVLDDCRAVSFMSVLVFTTLVLLMLCRSSIGFIESSRVATTLVRGKYSCCHKLFLSSESKEESTNQNENQPSVRHKILWTTGEGTVEFEAKDGELLRTAALRRGIVTPHNGKSKLINCRGLGTCGTCAIEVAVGGKVEPADKNAREILRLSFPPHNPDQQSPLLRLACQIQVRGDLHVTKRSGFWGQYDDLSSSSRHETYFGDLEFILDGRSPTE